MQGCVVGCDQRLEAVMATMRLAFWRAGSAGEPFRVAADSVKAREAIHAAGKKSGGPTPELKRVYGEYLDYKRARAATSKN
jgi:hypothetical protein